jgi:hypothetical protein
MEAWDVVLVEEMGARVKDLICLFLMAFCELEVVMR